MKSSPVIIHLDAENDRDALAILDRLEIATDRDGALSILGATVRRGLRREITRQRRAVIVNRWRESLHADKQAKCERANERPVTP